MDDACALELTEGEVTAIEALFSLKLPTLGRCRKMLTNREILHAVTKQGELQDYYCLVTKTSHKV